MMHIPLRSHLLLAAALLAAGCGSGSEDPTLPPPTGPAIATIAPVTIAQDTTAMVPLSLTDDQAAVSSLVVTAKAANGSLVLPSGLAVIEDNGVPTLNITPAESATGSTQITVTVVDAMGGMASTSFTLTVNAVNLSFTTLAQEVLAKSETDPPVQVNGFTIIEDADDSTIFDALFDQAS
jgi:hypothetical protein